MLRRFLALRIFGRNLQPQDAVTVKGYDLFVRAMRLGLSLVALGFLTFVVLWPTLRDDEVSFTLSYEDVLPSDDQIHMVNLEYVGTDKRDRMFKISADRGIQSSPDDPRIRLETIAASMMLEPGIDADVTSTGGTYYVKAKVLVMDGGMELITTDGYRFSAGASRLDLGNRLVTSDAPIEGTSKFGDFAAQGFQIRVDDRLVIFDGRTRMRVFPGGRP